ncbi:hypothetical protein BT63DRAFT_429179 [Microthyrium microscopicum]|uniref:DUF7719 domain-containing protein n=1 Tax=Microthyrium microscopicum TaxID=703497 RepID=A0A6A6U1D8_9PEZI|nr:hypothetical protein BT63DRAFT_429179 [Microthyrium microscopicum]
MSEQPEPRNRRERRAADKSAGKTKTKAAKKTPSPEIPMVMPDYDSKPTGKTLLQIAEERRHLLEKGQPFPANAVINPDGTVEGSNNPDIDVTDLLQSHDTTQFLSDEPLGAFANALIYCISLSMLHVTLDVMVLTQYNQDVEWRLIAGRMLRLTPALFVVLYVFHTEGVKRWKKMRQLFFLGLSIGAGCYMLYAANEFGYYFVMRRCPPLGTLWVWSVIEMDLAYALVHAATVLGFMWWGEYKAF